MKRTTIYLEPDLEMRLKLEVQRQKRPMAELIREAVHAYLTREPQRTPPGAGAFASGRTGTASDLDAALAETGFGSSPAPPRTKRRAR
jgi:predicted transcriptional regulator